MKSARFNRNLRRSLRSRKSVKRWKRLKRMKSVKLLKGGRRKTSRKSVKRLKSVNSVKHLNKVKSVKRLNKVKSVKRLKGGRKTSRKSLKRKTKLMGGSKCPKDIDDIYKNLLDAAQNSNNRDDFKFPSLKQYAFIDRYYILRMFNCIIENTDAKNDAEALNIINQKYQDIITSSEWYPGYDPYSNFKEYWGQNSTKWKLSASGKIQNSEKSNAITTNRSKVEGYTLSNSFDGGINELDKCPELHNVNETSPSIPYNISKEAILKIIQSLNIDAFLKSQIELITINIEKKQIIQSEPTLVKDVYPWDEKETLLKDLELFQEIIEKAREKLTKISCSVCRMIQDHWISDSHFEIEHNKLCRYLTIGNTLHDKKDGTANNNPIGKGNFGSVYIQTIGSTIDSTEEIYAYKKDFKNQYESYLKSLEKNKESFNLDNLKLNDADLNNPNVKYDDNLYKLFSILINISNTPENKLLEEANIMAILRSKGEEGDEDEEDEDGMLSGNFDYLVPLEGIYYNGIFNETRLYLPYYPYTDLQKQITYQEKNKNDIITIAKHVSSGMILLEKLKIVHCDLAARNIMVHSVSETETIYKIGDFGMSKLISKYGNEEYYKCGNNKLGTRLYSYQLHAEIETYKLQDECIFPLTHTSPETYKTGQYNIQNDIWAFGCILLEVLYQINNPFINNEHETHGLPNNDALKAKFKKSTWDLYGGKSFWENYVYQITPPLVAGLVSKGNELNPEDAAFDTTSGGNASYAVKDTLAAAERVELIMKTQANVGKKIIIYTPDEIKQQIESSINRWLDFPTELTDLKDILNKILINLDKKIVYKELDELFATVLLGSIEETRLDELVNDNPDYDYSNQILSLVNITPVASNNKLDLLKTTKEKIQPEYDNWLTSSASSSPSPPPSTSTSTSTSGTNDYTLEETTTSSGETERKIIINTPTHEEVTEKIKQMLSTEIFVEKKDRIKSFKTIYHSFNNILE